MGQNGDGGKSVGKELGRRVRLKMDALEVTDKIGVLEQVLEPVSNQGLFERN